MTTVDSDGTLGRKASYSPTDSLDPLTPGRPVRLGYNQYDTAIREHGESTSQGVATAAAPKPDLKPFPAKGYRKMMFKNPRGGYIGKKWNKAKPKQKIIFASIVLALLIILIIALLAYFLSRGSAKSHTEAQESVQPTIIHSATLFGNYSATLVSSNETEGAVSRHKRGAKTHRPKHHHHRRHSSRRDTPPEYGEMSRTGSDSNTISSTQESTIGSSTTVPATTVSREQERETLEYLLNDAFKRSETCEIFDCSDVLITEFSFDGSQLAAEFAVVLNVLEDQVNSTFDQDIMADTVNFTKVSVSNSLSDVPPFSESSLLVESSDLYLDFGAFCLDPNFNCEVPEPTNTTEETTTTMEMTTETTTETTTTEMETSTTSTEPTTTETEPETTTTLEPTTTAEPEPPTTTLPLAPPVANCRQHGFQCRTKAHEKVSNLKVCDGKLDCEDGSDEDHCSECRTSISCGSDPQALTCLRGPTLCDGRPDCPDSFDEDTVYCRSDCDLNKQYKCRNVSLCVPKAWVCDGDTHCPLGDDESNCDENSCQRREGSGAGARWCAADRICIPSWQWCDGARHCSDGADEEACSCAECSGKALILCSQPEGRCLQRSQLCDGKNDCADGEDEIGCPGWCQLEHPVDNVVCRNGKLVPRRHACAGVEEECDDACRYQCDPELAFQCRDNGKCIPRRNMCNHDDDCGDGSDEQESICSCDVHPNAPRPFQCEPQIDTLPDAQPKCIPLNFTCDGYHDCPGGDDESNCRSGCKNAETANVVFCSRTQTCHPSSNRCDGHGDCDDFSDEDGCTCTECKSHNYETYMCQKNNRCLRKEYICNSGSLQHCPGRSPEDENVCHDDFDPLYPHP